VAEVAAHGDDAPRRGNRVLGGSIRRSPRIAPRIGCRRFCAAFGRRDLALSMALLAKEEFPGRLASSNEVTGSSRAPDESPIPSFSRIDRRPGRALTRCKHQRA
jgi:hypothetical protein